VNAFLAIEGWRSAFTACDRLPRTHIYAGLRPTFFAEAGSDKDDVIGETSRCLDLPSHQQHVLVGDEQLAVALDLRPAASVHQRIVKRDVVGFGCVRDGLDGFL
jgi:hypothetical protein